MRAWIIPIPEANWEVIKKMNVYGAPEDSAAPKLISIVE